MLFKTIASAIVAGIVAGLILFIVQRWTTLPLIHQAELYERSEKAPQSASTANDPPQDESLRSAYTCLSDMLLAIGFGMALAAIYVLRDESGLWPGILWGIGGFATFHLGPALVVPPSIPGLEIAPLATRQNMWLIAALSTSLGLALVFFGQRTVPAGVFLMVLPTLLLRYLFPLAARAPLTPALSTLEHSFIVWTLTDSLLMWLVLGAVSGWMFENLHSTDRRRGENSLQLL